MPLPPVQCPPPTFLQNDPLYYWRFGVQIFEMLGVVGAVVLALWEKLRHYIFKPKLRLDFATPDTPVVDELIRGNSDNQSIRYACKLVLENTGRAVANRCTLHLVGCQRVNPSPLTYPVIPNPTPWASDKEVITIHRGDRPTLKLFTLQEKPQPGEINATKQKRRAVLEVPVAYNDEVGDPLVLEPGEYLLHVVVLAEGGHRTELFVDLRFSGEWHDHAVTMKEHVWAARKVQ